MDKKNNSGMLVGILIGIIIMLVVCIGLFVTGTVSFKSTTTDNKQTSNNEQNSEANTLSEQEALNIGKELYDKATTVHETWQLLPYCGVSSEELNNKKIENIGKASRMYESDFKDLNELKEYLATFLSTEIINQHIKEEAITDLSILDQDNKEYTDYAIKDGKLYCRFNTGKGWLSRYLNNYDMKVNTIKNDLIIYDVKLANVAEYVATQTNSKCTYGGKISDCKENEIEYVDTKFIIKKVNDNWIVTDYKLHD